MKKITVKKIALLILAFVLIVFDIPTSKAAENGNGYSADYSTLVLSEDEIHLVAALCHLETPRESLLSKICFCAMILNRLQDERFPNSVREVVFDQGAFKSAESGKLSTLPENSEIETDLFAMRQVLDKNIDPTCGSVFTMKSDDPSVWEIFVLFTVDDRVFGVIT